MTKIGKGLLEPDRGKKKVNWLLCGLIVVSLVLHGVMLLYLSKGLSFKRVPAIKISMLKESRPRAREIPRPQLPRALPDSRRKVEPDSVHDLSVPEPVALPVDLNKVKPKDSGPRQTPVADVPKAVPVKAHAVSPQEQAEDAKSGARMDYLNLVRLRIEDNKQYPARALNRGFEGRVTVGFVILSDGRIFQTGVVKSSGHLLLDEAALDAVLKAAPFPPLPEQFFAGRLEVSIPIIFELIQR